MSSAPVDGGAAACTPERDELGWGIRWDARRGELLRVDARVGLVHRSRPGHDGTISPVRTYQLPFPIAGIAPLHGDDGWLLAAGRGFVHLAPSGGWRTVREAVPEGAHLTDASCDPQGRCWAGSTADHEGAGALHRLDQNGHVETVLGDLTMPGGLGWSPDGSTLYLADSGPGVVMAFAFDVEHGRLSAGYVLIAVPERDGAPTGLAVDSSGDLWVAIDTGGCVHRYSSDGWLRAVHVLPALRCTSCAFVGRRLYVTTATEGRAAGPTAADPAAGFVYRLETDATGRPAAPFVPEFAWWRSDTAGASPDRRLPPSPG